VNSYSDIPFYVQSLLSDEDDYGVVLLLTLTPRYVAPEECVNIFGMKIKKSGFKPIDWKNIVKSDLPRSKRTSLPWEVGTITSFDPPKYGVTREKAPLYEMGQTGDLSEFSFPILRADLPGGTLFEVDPLIPSAPPMPTLKIWNMDNDLKTVDWINPRIDTNPTIPETTEYEVQKIYQMGSDIPISVQYKPIPVKTIDITFNIEKEDE